MAEFINTADVIGDEELTDQIIMRTVTEYKENRINTVGQCAFYGCTQLAEVDLPEVTTIGLYAFSYSGITDIKLPKASTITQAFQYCDALKRISLPSLSGSNFQLFNSSRFLLIADLGVVTTLNQQVFQGCYRLKAVILRSPTLVTLENTNAFAGCHWIRGLLHYETNPNQEYGYFYVPRALVDSYKVATNWSDYPDQFRALEDYTVDGTTTGELDESKI